MKRIEAEQKLQDWALDGGNYQDIRKKAIKQGFEGASLQLLMRKIDRIIHNKAQENAKIRQYKEQILFGCSMLVIGLLMTVYSWFTDYNMYLFIVYPVIVVAMYFTVKAYSQLKSF